MCKLKLDFQNVSTREWKIFLLVSRVVQINEWGCYNNQEGLKGLKRELSHVSMIRLVSRIFWHKRIIPSLKEWRF